MGVVRLTPTLYTFAGFTLKHTVQQSQFAPSFFSSPDRDSQGQLPEIAASAAKQAATTSNPGFASTAHASTTSHLTTQAPTPPPIGSFCPPTCRIPQALARDISIGRTMAARVLLQRVRKHHQALSLVSSSLVSPDPGALTSHCSTTARRPVDRRRVGGGRHSLSPDRARRGSQRPPVCTYSNSIPLTPNLRTLTRTSAPPPA